MRLSTEAQRKLRRRRRNAEIIPLIILGGLAAGYWFRDYLGLPSEAALYWVAAFVLLGFHHVDRRLKAIQFRLAEMHDRLDELAGAEPEHHVEAELDDD